MLLPKIKLKRKKRRLLISLPFAWLKVVCDNGRADGILLMDIGIYTMAMRVWITINTSLQHGDVPGISFVFVWCVLLVFTLRSPVPCVCKHIYRFIVIEGRSQVCFAGAKAGIYGKCLCGNERAQGIYARTLVKHLWNFVNVCPECFYNAYA